MTDITLTYKGSTIATINSSGTTTLGTSGKWCEDDITLQYVRPGGGGTPTNMIANWDFHDGTNGWSSINTQASISVSGGKLILTHNTTSNRNYGVYCDVTVQAGHIYLIKYKLTKSIDDTDGDARGIIIWFGTTSGQEITRITGVAQGTTLENVTAARADASATQIRITFLGPISTTASSDSMLEIEYVKMYDITDIIP